MTAEILVNIGPRESRAALLENGVLQEIFIERASRRGIVGNIYKGRVSRVLPGMQAAFVDAGLERTAFLHVDDIAAAHVALDAQRMVAGDPRPTTSAEAGGDAARNGGTTDIRRLVNAGDDIVVQVLKDPIGGKGARLTTFVSLPSRLLVYMPRGKGLGVSARIESEAERTRLRDAFGAIVREGHPGGYIVRTAAEGATSEQLAADLAYLERLWTHVREQSLRASPGQLIHADLGLPLRMLRDELAPTVQRVLVDDAAEHSGRLPRRVERHGGGGDVGAVETQRQRRVVEGARRSAGEGRDDGLVDAPTRADDDSARARAERDPPQIDRPRRCRLLRPSRSCRHRHRRGPVLGSSVGTTTSCPR